MTTVRLEEKDKKLLKTLKKQLAHLKDVEPGFYDEFLKAIFPKAYKYSEVLEVNPKTARYLLKNILPRVKDPNMRIKFFLNGANFHEDFLKIRDKKWDHNKVKIYVILEKTSIGLKLGGVVLFELNDDIIMIRNLATANFNKEGYGTKLYEAVLDYAKQNNFKYVYVDIMNKDFWVKKHKLKIVKNIPKRYGDPSISGILGRKKINKDSMKKKIKGVKQTIKDLKYYNVERKRPFYKDITISEEKKEMEKLLHPEVYEYSEPILMTPEVAIFISKNFIDNKTHFDPIAERRVFFPFRNLNLMQEINRIQKENYDKTIQTFIIIEKTSDGERIAAFMMVYLYYDHFTVIHLHDRGYEDYKTILFKEIIKKAEREPTIEYIYIYPQNIEIGEWINNFKLKGVDYIPNEIEPTLLADGSLVSFRQTIKHKKPYHKPLRSETISSPKDVKFFKIKKK